MQAKFLGDALDIWKGRMIRLLTDGDPTRTTCVVPMRTDASWSSKQVTTYATLLAIERRDVIAMNHRYTWAEREQYFSTVISDLKDRESCDVFLDPDTGLAPTRGSRAHASYASVGRLVNQDSGRLVIVYQHRRRSSGWLRALVDEASSAVGVSVCGYDGGSAAAVCFARRARRISDVARRLQDLLGPSAAQRVVRVRRSRRA